MKKIILKNSHGEVFNAFKSDDEAEISAFISREFTSGIHGPGITKEEVDITDEEKKKQAEKKRLPEMPTLAEFLAVWAEDKAQDIAAMKNKIKATIAKHPENRSNKP